MLLSAACGLVALLGVLALKGVNPVLGIALIAVACAGLWWRFQLASQRGRAKRREHESQQLPYVSGEAKRTTQIGKRTRVAIVASEFIVAITAALVVGNIEHSVGWGIAALMAAGVAYLFIALLLALLAVGYSRVGRRR